MGKTHKRKTNKEKAFLSLSFVPDETHVIIGKGMKYYHHAGNMMMRNIITSMIHEYAAAKSKKEKSKVLNSILKQIRMNGDFVKKDTEAGLWFHADDTLARDKISQQIRRMLNNDKGSKHKSMEKKRFYAKKSEAYWGRSLLRCKEEISTNSLPDFDFFSDTSLSTISSICWNLPTHDDSSIFTDMFSNDVTFDQTNIFEPMDKEYDSSKDCMSLESDSIYLEIDELSYIPPTIYFPT